MQTHPFINPSQACPSPATPRFSIYQFYQSIAELTPEAFLAKLNPPIP
ncbi:hypothetical protein MC7420_4245 [Coleofasciculus chthonoplastes PCC 7420]|uniref:Uncharacterized protein n=1 Tax=Coleofasciculus chthonoplastes PCC 7420 TaxID=118168 RepID=B4VVF7_9CYAN|nr:hypothetical protein MC7420_4245 [Coleofasciculus chthonoplastes PCC 7420]